MLIVHDRRPRRGGVDPAVDDETEMLALAGHVVLRHPAGPLGAGAAAVDADAALGAAIDAFRPDIVHVHDLFPGLSNAVYALAAARRVPLVQTLHDFRIACPQGQLFRDGRPCEDCVGKRPWPAVVHLCHGSGRGEAMTAARASVTQRRHAMRHVARFIVPSEFVRGRVVAAGLPAERVVVKPHSLDMPVLEETTRMGFLFVGSLSVAKGIDVLADALRYEQLEGDVRIVGDGPARTEAESHPRLHALGSLSPASVREEMRRAVALVMPSRHYETFPRALAEAFALGLPVIASRRGALAALVDDGRTGVLFTPGSGADLAAKLRWAETHPDRMAAMGLAARRHYEREFSHEVNYPRLMAVYADAIAAAPRA